MPNPKSPGRMIRKDISKSAGFASLTPKAAALFCLLIPHFDSHGKMNGNPNFIKGEIAHLIPWLKLPTIRNCLREITDKTNVKWFEHNRCWYVHSTNWKEHQDLRGDRLGSDRLPSFPGLEAPPPPTPKKRSWRTPGAVQEESGSSPGVVPPEVEVEVEVEVQGKEEIEVKVPADGPPAFPEKAWAAAEKAGGNSTEKVIPAKLAPEVLKAQEELVRKRRALGLPEAGRQGS